MDPLTDVPVGWRASEGTVRAMRTNGQEHDLVCSGEAQITVSLAAGEVVDVTLEVVGSLWEAGELEGVGVERLRSLELVRLLLDRSTGAEGLEPIGARDVALDDLGEVVFGPPVSWGRAR